MQHVRFTMSDDGFVRGQLYEHRVAPDVATDGLSHAAGSVIAEAYELFETALYQDPFEHRGILRCHDKLTGPRDAQ